MLECEVLPKTHQAFLIDPSCCYYCILNTSCYVSPMYLMKLNFFMQSHSFNIVVYFLKMPKETRFFFILDS